LLASIDKVREMRSMRPRIDGTRTALSEVVELPTESLVYEDFNRHMKDIKRKTRFSLEYPLTFIVYAFPCSMIICLFYWSGASWNSFLLGHMLIILFSFAIAYTSKQIAGKRAIMESCFYFNPLYTDFLLSHPVVNKNVIDHLNNEMFHLCMNNTSPDGTEMNNTNIRMQRRKAAEIVCNKILVEFKHTMDVILVRSKRK